MKRNVDLGLLTIRLSIGVLMLLHGLQKLQKGVGGIEKMLAQHNLPTWIAYGVYIGEIIAPILLIIGMRSRLAGIIVAFTCIMAMYLVHSKDIFTRTNTGAWGVELLGLFLFGSLSIVFAGGGKYALSRQHKWD